MKLPRCRLTVRRMIAVVAIIALIIGVATYLMRADHYRRRARHHALMERSSVIAVVDGAKPAEQQELDELNRAWTAHHGSLRRKYEAAATRPWAYVAPDPPEPFAMSGPGRRVDLHFGD